MRNTSWIVLNKSYLYRFIFINFNVNNGSIGDFWISG